MKLKSLGGLRNTGEGASIKVLANDGLKISDKGLMLLGGSRGESRIDVVQDTDAAEPTFYIELTSKTDDKEKGGFKVAKTGQLNSKSICELLGGKGTVYTISETSINAGTQEEPRPVFLLTEAGVEDVTPEEEEGADEAADEAAVVDAAPRRRGGDAIAAE